jgi:hypothetical protein
MKITLSKAKELCIKKWEYIVENDGDYSEEDLVIEIPELIDLFSNCAYCELFIDEWCNHCPINLGKGVYKNIACLYAGHPFHTWVHKRTKENAQTVLNLIKEK